MPKIVEPADLLAVARQKAANAALLDALDHPSDLHNQTFLAVQKALDDGADPNVRATKVEHGKGFRPLHVAAVRGVPKEVIDLLIARGADVSVTAANGETPLHVAARRNRIDAVDALLDAGADLRARTKAGHTPLGAALLFLVPAPMVEHLLARGASLDELDWSEPHPLHHAVRQLNVDTVGFLLDHGVSPNTRDRQGSLPIGALRGSVAFEGTVNGSAERALAIVERLIDAGAELNTPVTHLSGETALSYLLQAQEVPLPVVKRLLDAGSSPYGQPFDPAVPSRSSFSLGTLAARCNVEVLMLLLDHGLNVNHTDRFGETMLHHALDTAGGREPEARFEQTLVLLLERGANVNLATAGGNLRTPLHTALLIENEERRELAVRTLLAAGANPNLLSGKEDVSPLIVTIDGTRPASSLPSINLLLAHGANPWTATRKGVPMLLNTDLPEEILTRIEQHCREHRERSPMLAEALVAFWQQDDPDQLARHNAKFLPMLIDMGVEPGDIVHAFRQRSDGFRADSLMMIEPTVREMEAQMLGREIDQTEQPTDPRDRPRL